MENSYWQSVKRFEKFLTELSNTKTLMIDVKPKYGNKSELVHLVKKEEYPKRKYCWKCSPQISLSTRSVTWQLKVATNWLFPEWKYMAHRQDCLRTRRKNQVKDGPDRFFYMLCIHAYSWGNWIVSWVCPGMKIKCGFPMSAI